MSGGNRKLKGTGSTDKVVGLEQNHPLMPTPGTVTMSTAVRRNIHANYDFPLGSLGRTMDTVSPGRHHLIKTADIQKIQNHLGRSSVPQPQNPPGPSSRVTDVLPVRGGVPVDGPIARRHKLMKKKMSVIYSRPQPRIVRRDQYPTRVDSSMHIIRVVNGKPVFPGLHEDAHFRHDFTDVPKAKTERLRKHQERFSGLRTDDIFPRFRSSIPMAGFGNDEITFRTDGMRIVITGQTKITDQSRTHQRKVIEVVDIPLTTRVKDTRILRDDYGSIIIEERRSLEDFIWYDAEGRPVELEKVREIQSKKFNRQPE